MNPALAAFLFSAFFFGVLLVTAKWEQTMNERRHAKHE
jgi:hypothetical protein